MDPIRKGARGLENSSHGHHFLSEHRNRLIFLLASLILALIGCEYVPDDSKIDRSFLNDEPCAPPCWYGLEIGTSTRDQVYRTLKSLAFVDPDSIRETGTVWMNDEAARSVSWGCLSSRTAFCGNAGFSQERLTSLLLTVNYDLTAEMVVHKLGPPDELQIAPLYPQGSTVYLTWNDKRIVAVHTDHESRAVLELLGKGKPVPPNLRIETVNYLTKDWFDFRSRDCPNCIPWPGFGP